MNVIKILKCLVSHKSLAILMVVMIVPGLMLACKPKEAGEPSPTTAAGWVKLAGERKEQEDFLGAIEAYEGAIKLDANIIDDKDVKDDIVGAYLGRGEYWRNQGNLASAEYNYRTAAALDPTNADAHHMVGKCLSELGDSRAIEAYEEAIKLDANTIDDEDVDNLLNMGVSLADIGDYAGAITALEIAVSVELTPAAVSTLATAYNNCGVVEATQGNYAKAKEYFIKAIDIDSTNPEFPNNIGICLAQEEKYDDATDYFSRALEVDNSFLPAWNNKACAYAAQGRLTEARGLLEQATELAMSDEWDDTNWPEVVKENREVVNQAITEGGTVKPSFNFGAPLVDFISEVGENYHIIYDQENGYYVAVWYEKTNDKEFTFYASLYDGTSKTWSDRIKLTEENWYQLFSPGVRCCTCPWDDCPYGIVCCAVPYCKCLGTIKSTCVSMDVQQ